MVQTFNFGYISIHLWEWAALPIYVMAILLMAYYYQKRKRETNPLYRYYMWGLIAKVGGSIFFALIYFYYYAGGDTFGYYESALAMRNLLIESPLGWLRNEFQGASPENLAFFNSETGSPLAYMYNDPRTFMVIRIMSILVIPAYNSYLLASIIIAWVCYTGIWKMYLVFTAVYPKLEKQFAIAILFFPSVLFWGSGILKDTITLSCTGWVIYCIYRVFILKKHRLFNTVVMLLNIYLILVIKPYIIFALLPGGLMWIFSERIYRIKNFIVKLLVIPFIVVSCATSGYFILSQLGSYLGKFSLEKVTKTALVTQNDLKQSYYQGHSFDIGLIDQTPSGFAKKAPEALLAGVYRPFLWESGNIVMLLSGLENTFILLLTLLMLLRNNLFSIPRRLFSEPLLFFSLTYSVFFAIAVGITTSNFGALVRFKIAYLPLLMAALFILIKKRTREETASLSAD
ncbi:MAG TPA: hypothetical protein VNZ45_01440 [Bacteroidia bacterium]|jgi:hypothetical protein|nr:hypothetical protein [Bacteroidia bacterium]